jgi:magnesium chelatase family protein
VILTSCHATSNLGTRYQKRISGPLLARIDIHAEVPRVEFDKLADDRLGEPSSIIRKRVEVARESQRERFKGTELVCNADMGPSEVRIFCGLDESGRSLVRQAMTQLQLTARAFHRVLKLARTIADLSGDEEILTHHLAEALQYRPRRWT